MCPALTWFSRWVCAGALNSPQTSLLEARTALNTSHPLPAADARSFSFPAYFGLASTEMWAYHIPWKHVHSEVRKQRVLCTATGTMFSLFWDGYTEVYCDRGRGEDKEEGDQDPWSSPSPFDGYLFIYIKELSFLGFFYVSTCATRVKEFSVPY